MANIFQQMRFRDIPIRVRVHMYLPFISMVTSKFDSLLITITVIIIIITVISLLKVLLKLIKTFFTQPTLNNHLVTYEISINYPK